MRLRLIAAALGAAAVVVPLGVAGRQAPRNGVGRGPAYALTIRLKQPDYKAGSEIWAEVAFRNVSDHEIEITPRLAGLSRPEQAHFYYVPDVRDEKGNAVSETEFGRRVRKGEAFYVGGGSEALGQHYNPLHPGESRTSKIRLDDLYDLSTPGKYTVQVQFLDTGAATVKSNIVTLTITK